MYVGRSYRWNTSSEKLIALCFTWLSPPRRVLTRMTEGSSRDNCSVSNRTEHGPGGMACHVHDWPRPPFSGENAPARHPVLPTDRPTANQLTY